MLKQVCKTAEMVEAKQKRSFKVVYGITNRGNQIQVARSIIGTRNKAPNSHMALPTKYNQASTMLLRLPILGIKLQRDYRDY